MLLVFDNAVGFAVDIDVGFEQIFCVDIAVDMVVGFAVDFVTKGDKIVDIAVGLVNITRVLLWILYFFVF